MKGQRNKLPLTASFFLKRAVFLLVIWLLSYHLFLESSRVVDKPLTDVTAFSVSKVLSLIYDSSYFRSFDDKAVVYTDGRYSIGISDSCNGLDLYLIFLGFILCMPSTAFRKVQFISGGLISMFLLNIVRCIALALISANLHSWFDFAHHYLFYIVVYGYIFLLWARFSKKLKPVEAKV